MRAVTYFFVTMLLFGLLLDELLTLLGITHDKDHER